MVVLVSIFNEKALSNHNNRLFGKVNARISISLHLISAAIFATAMILFAYLYSTEMHRKVSVDGYLHPDKGVINIFSEKSGYIEEVFINVGQPIKKGDAITKLYSAVSNDPDNYLRSIIRNKTQAKIEALKAKERNLSEMFEKEKNEINRKITMLDENISLVQRQVNLSEEDIDLHEEHYSRLKMLESERFISQQSINQSITNIIEAKKELAYNSERYLELQSSKQNLRYKLAQLELNKNEDLANITVDKLNESIELDLKDIAHQYYIKATQSGVVTSVKTKKGEYVLPNSQIATIMPENTTLQAKVFVPSQASGLIDVGQTVNLKLSAFPFQKFGFIRGKIEVIEQTITLPHENSSSINIHQPYYLVIVNLEQDHMNAYGRTFPLKAGMLLQADIILEKRSLLDWLLEPVYTLRGKPNYDH
jgi:membrane fusion protein